MNWLSAMNSNSIGSMGGFSMGASFGGVAGFGDSMGSAAFGISGSPWSSGNTSSFLMGGLVGNTMCGCSNMYGGGFGNAFGGTLQNSFQQQPMMPPYAMGYGSSMGQGYGSSMGMGYGSSMGMDYGSSMGMGYGSSMGMDYGSSMGMGYGSSMGMGYGSSMGMGYGSSMGMGYGSSMGMGYGSSMGMGYGSSMGMGYGSSMGMGYGSSMGMGYGSSMGMGYGSSMGMGYGSSMGMGYGSSMGMGYGSSMGMGYGSSMGMGYGSSMGTGYGSSYGGYDFGGSNSYGGGSYGFQAYAGISSPSASENPYQRADSAFPNYNGGQLTQDGQGKPISYETSGGYKVSVDGTTVTVTDPNGKNQVSEWGDPHENVNGQKADDWSGTSRTLLLGDGTKVTMGATAANSTINTTSIYDGSQEVQIDNTQNQITKVSNNPYQTRHDERTQVDGDTAYFGMNRSGSEVFKNLYTQNSDYSVTRNHQELATLNQPFS